MNSEDGGSMSASDGGLPRWATPFRVVVLVLVAGFWGYYIGRHPFSARGGWRYLTNWGLTLNLMVALFAVAGIYLPKFRYRNPLLPTALTISSLVVVLYWTLWAIDPALVTGSYPLPWYSDLYLHLGTTLGVYVEAFMLHRAPARVGRPLASVVGVGLVYILWIEFVVSVSNTKPCGLVESVCGYPYPFLNDLNGMERCGFYGAGGAVVLLLSVGIMKGWKRVQERMS